MVKNSRDARFPIKLNKITAMKLKKFGQPKKSYDYKIHQLINFYKKHIKEVEERD